MLTYYLPHLIFFAVFFVAALPIIYYIWKKNPDPRFRPHAGEMSLIFLFAAFICGGMAFGLGSLFKPENDGSAMKKKPNEGAGWSAGDYGGDTGGPKKKSNSKDDSETGGDTPSPRRGSNDRN